VRAIAAFYEAEKADRRPVPRCLRIARGSSYPTVPA
jgi:hypothetical protein